MEAITDGKAYQAAAHAYIKALFSKIRKIDSGIGESVYRREDAYERRIDGGKRLND